MLKPGSIPAKVDRIDIATGQRTFFREFGPADRSGLTIYFTNSILRLTWSQCIAATSTAVTLCMVTPKAK